MDEIVQLRGVRKACNSGTAIETEVLHGINLTINRGEFFAIVRPSGSDKSTLPNIAGLLDRADFRHARRQGDRLKPHVRQRTDMQSKPRQRWSIGVIAR